jgi:hypothetical protein
MMLMIIVGAALLFVIGRAAAADRRIWLDRRSRGKASAAMGFAAIEEIFSPSAGRAREVLQEQKRVGQRAPTPGDWLDDGPWVTSQFAGKLTVSVNRSQTADAPDERQGIASRD